MKHIVAIVTASLAVTVASAAANAQTVQQRVTDASNGAASALAATGLPLWAWIVIALAIVLILAFAIGRRRRSSQAIIKTRLG